MAQTTIMVLKVDLGCERCYKKIKKLLCKIPEIKEQSFFEKEDTVRIKVVCCSPERIRSKLICKGGKIIKSIEIKVPENPKPPPEKPKEAEKPKPQPEKPKEAAEKPKPLPEKAKEAEKPKPAQVPPPVTGFPPIYPFGFWCNPSCGGRCGGPCHHGCGIPQPPPSYDGYVRLVPSYDGWASGCRCDRSYGCRCEENPAACTIM